MKKTILVVLVAVVLAVGAGLGIRTAVASDEVTERGACGTTAYELSVEDDDGAPELSFELQATGPGETWQVVVEQGDREVLSGERMTDEDAELDLDAVVDDGGSDTFTVTATPASGEACIATVTR